MAARGGNGHRVGADRGLCRGVLRFVATTLRYLSDACPGHGQYGAGRLEHPARAPVTVQQYAPELEHRGFRDAHTPLVPCRADLTAHSHWCICSMQGRRRCWSPRPWCWPRGHWRSIGWPAVTLGDNPLAEVVFPLAYLLFPALQAANLYEFHAVTLTAALLLWAIDFADAGSYLAFSAMALAVIACKEEMGVVIAALATLDAAATLFCAGRNSVQQARDRDISGKPRIVLVVVDSRGTWMDCRGFSGDHPTLSQWSGHALCLSTD